MQPHQKAKYLPLLILDSLEAICSEFSLGVLQNQPEKSGSNNESFTLETDTGKYQVKSYAKSAEDPERFAALLQREISFVRYLEHAGIAVSHQITFQPFLFNSRLTTLTSYLPGKVIAADALSQDIMEKIGTLMAKLHTASIKYGQAGAKIEYHNTYRDRVEENIAAIEQVLNISRSTFLPLLDTYESFREKYETVHTHLPKGLIHSDITPGNLLLSDQGVAIIDFEGLRFAPFIFDFSQMLTTLTWKNGVFNKELVAAFFNAYEKVRPLTPEEKTAIPGHLVYNYLNKLEWRLTAALNKPGYVPIVKEQIAQAKTFMEQAQHIT